jgi:EAL domain-containing protein (putative c-di-GMP-specific phosphodiesterase class I)
MEKPQEAIEVLSRLKQMGIRIAVDDFGTGYSSLSTLKRLPLDVLKIDRSFVDGVPDDHDNAAIVRAIIALAHSLRLHLIAEGIERAEQHAFLEREGCQEGQGYLFSKPVEADTLERLLGGPS